MRHATGFLVLATVFAISPAAHADVVVATSLNLTQLQILPSAGSLLVLSPFTASANTQAQDDLSGVSSDFQQMDDGATSASAGTAFASASASASAPALAGGAASGVNITGATAFASSTGQGGLGEDFGGTGEFEIVDSSNPNPTNVSVTFNAFLSGLQSLFTDAQGQFATSEIVFNLLLPDIGSDALFLDNPLSIGTNSSLLSPLDTMLTTTLTLQTNTEYALIAEVDAESSGLNITPEPSFFSGSVVIVCSALLVRRARKKRTGVLPS